jgi:hypothetical protein
LQVADFALKPCHKPSWPDAARLAINFVINIEEGAERNILQGDAGSENYLTELALRESLPGTSRSSRNNTH